MRFVYTGIRVRDLEQSIRFYTRICGMDIISRGKISTTGGEIVVLKSPESLQELELNYYPNETEFKSGDELDHLAFEVEDLENFLMNIAKEGIKPKSEIIFGGVRWSKWCYIVDPDGIWIEINEKKSRT
ncbi:MAG: VOC family protein, partial [Candidatus Bathyarchaeia archaeon]